MKVMVLPCHVGVTLFYLHSVQSAYALIYGYNKQSAIVQKIQNRTIFYCCSSISAE